MASELSKNLYDFAVQYGHKLPEIIKTLEVQNQELTKKNDSTKFQDFVYSIHNLVEGAQNYNYLKVSHLAKDLEHYLKKNKKTWQTEYVNGQLEKIKLEIVAVQKALSGRNIVAEKQRLHNQVYCIVNSATRSSLQEISQMGYQVHFFNDFLDLSKVARPNVLLVDIDMLSTVSLGTLEAIFLKWESEVPIIYISSKDDVATRLKAVRYHGSSFLVMPINMFALLERLEFLSNELDADSCRVLMLEDSHYVGDYYKFIIQDAGIEVKNINDPHELLISCEEFQPDLILIDINLSEVSALELAKILRQDERHTTIPVLYFSMQSGQQEKMNPLEISMDDLITKPINPNYLISIIKSRIARANLLRSRIMRDSLTKLYNHSFIHQHLEIAIKVAQRYHSPLVFVMLDIDSFKAINDQYGHQVGDKVLRALSQYLRQHLRESDVVGRYGGEEFAIILPYTDLTAAEQLFNQLRSNFSLINQTTEETPVHVTFSAGIAAYSEKHDSQSLIAAADKALYKAKENGRNMVCIASTTATDEKN